tara:strand:- start:60 stop:425 length:366 start_codon:yes stop_codon:yes gene_type:complete
MRRASLLWFAAGAAAVSIAAVAAEVAFREATSDQAWFLRIGEPVQSMADGIQSAQWEGAEIARDCGAKNFEMIPGIAADATDSTRVPLVPENNPAMDCIIEKATKTGLWFGLELEPLDPNT